ncbi:MAG: iron ABC transporter permease [Treponema sp.]|nr:iron ABC transporter permease [Treponema sp.]
MKKSTARNIWFGVLLVLLLCAVFALSLMTGVVKPSAVIIKKLRLPRSLLVLLAGSLLGASGAVFQRFFQNPLAEPGLLGISSGATLGAVLSVSLGSISFFGGYISSINILAFAGAFISGMILALISALSGKKVSTVVVLLCGTAMGSLYSAVSSTLLLGKNKELYGIYTWILGSFNGRGIKELRFVIIPAIIAMVLMLFIASSLDLLNGGEESAVSLGVNIPLLRFLVITSGALAVSVAVCAGGTISFVGLIAPHIMQRIFRCKTRFHIITSALGGAILLLVSDIVCRTVIAPSELPCGIVISFLGAPFFIFVIINSVLGKRRKIS